MADKFVITGGKKLNGTIEVLGSKNAALPILAATILTKEECIIDNVPLIEDVLKLVKLLQDMGAKTEWLSERKIKISCEKIDPEKLSSDIMGKFRGSVLLWGPLAARFKSFKTMSPGGCVIGARPLDTHFDAFMQLGVSVLENEKIYTFTTGKTEKNNLDVILDEFSVTATENVLLFSAMQNCITTLQIADQDYQVQELVKVLEKMGAKIKFTGPHAFEISGKEKLRGFECKLIADPIEAGTFIVAVLAVKGDVLVKNVETQYLTLFLKKMKSFGANLEFPDEKSVRVLPSSNLVINKIQSLPYPGIQPDLQPEFGVLATQTKGATLIHDPLYEGRLKYLEELNKMGADIIFCDPHRAIVKGPTGLHGIEVPSLDIRGGAALIIAGLIAEGVTTINNAYQVDRGYEKIEERLQKLGADIKRVK